MSKPSTLLHCEIAMANEGDIYRGGGSFLRGGDKLDKPLFPVEILDLKNTTRENTSI